MIYDIVYLQYVLSSSWCDFNYFINMVEWARVGGGRGIWADPSWGLAWVFEYPPSPAHCPPQYLRMCAYLYSHHYIGN